MESVSNLFVVCMGLGTVFVGLISIIIICSVTGLICRAAQKKQVEAPAAVPAPAAPVSDLAPEKRREIIAAVSAALAEEMGTDISAIRIHSFKKL